MVPSIIFVASVNLAQAQLPEVFVKNVGVAVQKTHEDENFTFLRHTFIVNASRLLGSNEVIDVKYRITETGNCVRDKNILDVDRTIRITSANGSKEQFRVHWNNDNVDEVDCVITTTLKAGTGYTLSTTEPTSETITVRDDENPPVVSLSTSFIPTTAGPSNTADIFVTATGRWDAEFTVGINVTNRRGNFVAENSWPMNGITFPPNLTEDSVQMTYSIPTQFGDTDDDLYESSERSGSVTVTVSDDPAGGRTYYTVQNFTRSFPKTIRSEDIPHLTIIPPTTPVVEGNTAVFTITAEGKWDTAMTVYVEASSDIDELIGTPAPVTSIVFAPNLSANSVNMDFRVPTVESSQYRIGGLKLKANLGTSLGLYNQHYSVVQDDSSDPDCSATSTTKSCSEIIIRDKNNPPAVSITTQSSTINVGETATFTISATGNWTPAINIELELTKVGDFFANNDTTGSVSLEENMSDPSKSGTFEVVTMTDADAIYESTEFNGSITVIIKDVSSEPAPNYTITTSSVKVNVISEDIPEVSISAPVITASEGDQVEFTINATGQWETKFSVAVNTVAGSANLFGSPAPVNSIEFDPNTSTTSVSMMYLINTVDDDIDESEK